MTSYQYEWASQTISARVVHAGLLAKMCLENQEQINTGHYAPGYTDNINPSSTTKYTISLTEFARPTTNVNFEDEIAAFFTRLSSEQEPLGAEFEKVLFDNLWDLYQS